MTFTEDLFSVSGKTVLITGTSGGIGLELAKGFADAGARVIGCSRRTPATEGIFSGYLAADLSSEEDIETITAKFSSGYGKLHVLVNAAGTTFPQANEDFRGLSKLFDDTMKVNVKAAFLMIHALSAVLVDGESSIINITSIGQATGFPGNPSYVASKGGLAQLTKGFAFDLAPRGIRVNNIAPGYIRTSMTDKSYNDPELHQIRRRNMLLDRWGEPSDIVGGAIFLASKASSYVTGTTLFIDGGWMAKGMV